ncbi:MAG: BtrH N-terminal domain-containing protein [Tannerella sp.]|nr:BtrH N-terminal domain-containing protein [Tannerella sp.]
MKIDFKHSPAAHCECGVTSNMLRHYGIPVSEPMVFGIGAGLFFSYMPFIRLHKMPVFSFRPLPGHLFSRVTQRLGIQIRKCRFLNENKSMKALDRLLEQGTPVGNVVGVFYLPYFPKEYRFHFNAHNLCVIGKENDVYTVSDPVSLVMNELTHDELKRVRFAKGTYPPLGKMYWVKQAPSVPPDMKSAIISGLKLNCRRMLDIPIPYFGVKGITLLAGKMRRWEKKLGAGKAALQLAQVIRMLEEIGTGGAGFRYMYAAFLQEASDLLNRPEYREFSTEMTRIGDLWRDFAYEAARRFKKRGADICSYDQLADKLVAIAGEEKRFFTRLRESVK